MLADFILKTDFLKMGEECKKFEKSFSKKQNRKHCLFVSSGSSANLVLIQALLNLGRLKKGDKVALSSLTWSTNVMPIIQLGLAPVLLDCEMDNLNVSKRILENALIKNPDIRALFLTNVLGLCADISNIQDFCSQKNIIFLEDNCESLGSKIKDKLLGNFSLASTFSTFIAHHISTIEGGFVCTNDPDLHNMLLIVREHGWDRNLAPAVQNKLKKENGVQEFYSQFTFYDLAFNARPTEINGFIGNTQITYWDEIVNKRYSNYQRFQKAVQNNCDIFDLNTSHMKIVSNFAFPIIFKNNELFEKYRQKFEKEDVEIRPIIAGNMAKQPFFKKYVSTAEKCENIEFIHKNGFYFGNNPDLTEDELIKLCKLLEKSKY